jgi:hypothetical protein
MVTNLTTGRFTEKCLITLMHVACQMDLIEEYSKRGILTHEQIISIIEMINRNIEGYLSYLSLEYDLVLSRKQFFHRMLTMINDSSPRITEIVLRSLSLTRDMMNIGKQNKLS